MRNRIIFIALFLSGLVFTVVRAHASTPIAVTVASPLAYVFNGGTPGAPLSLLRGQTYIFQLSAAAAANHPFFISTTTGVEPPVPFVDPGLTGNGTATVTFTVPTTATVPLFYQCGVHTFMTNTITLASATAAPAVGLYTLLALGVALGGLGMLVFRARAGALSVGK